MAELTLTGLRVVRAVADHGSFTAAAHALGYTQSAVSRQVALTEQALGTTLFDRGARGVTATPAGSALRRHADAVLERLDVAALELGGLRDRVAGRVDLGAFPTALAALVPRALARLSVDEPGVEVRLREGGTPAQLRRLRAGRLDVAVIAAGEGLPSYDLDGLAVKRLSEGVLLLAVGRTHRLAGRRSVALGELEQERWIVGDAGAGGPEFAAWPTLAGSPEVVHVVSAWPARLGLVAAGLGVAAVPALAAPSVPADVALLTVDEPAPQRRTALAVTASAPSAGAAALVEALGAEAAALAATTRPSG